MGLRIPDHLLWQGETIQKRWLKPRRELRPILTLPPPPWSVGINSSHFYLYFNLQYSCDDGQLGVIGAQWFQLPRLEWHIDVLILYARQLSKVDRLER